MTLRPILYLKFFSAGFTTLVFVLGAGIIAEGCETW